MPNSQEEIDNLIDSIMSGVDGELNSEVDQEPYTDSNSDSESKDGEIPQEEDHNFVLEYMRFDNPVYHLTYKIVGKTFCGLDISGTEYKSTRTEPELLDPCKRCMRMKNQLTEQEQLEQLRDQISEQVADISSDPEVPNQFTADELAGLIEQIPVSIEIHDRDIDTYRSRLSRAVEGISDTDSEAGLFNMTEMESLKGALEGNGLISVQNYIYFYSDQGRVKRTSLDEFRLQSRGGKGLMCFDFYERERLTEAHLATPRQSLLFLTNYGLVHQVSAQKIPKKGRTEGGDPVHDLFNMKQDEHIQAVLPVEDIDDQGFLTTVSKNGFVKRTKVSEFKNIRNGGIKAMKVKSDDEICEAIWTNGEMDILLGTTDGRAIRFDEKEVRAMGRTALGVKGIELSSGSYVSGMSTIPPDVEGDVCTVTHNGFGKRTNPSDYLQQKRLGSGLKDINTDDRNGSALSIEFVSTGDDIILVSSEGQLIRFEVSEVASIGRNTMGVILMTLEDGDELVSMVIT